MVLRNMSPSGSLGACRNAGKACVRGAAILRDIRYPFVVVYIWCAQF